MTVVYIAVAVIVFVMALPLLLFLTVGRASERRMLRLAREMRDGGTSAAQQPLQAQIVQDAPRRAVSPGRQPVQSAPKQTVRMRVPRQPNTEAPTPRSNRDQG